MAGPLDWSLIDGPVPTTILALGAASVLCLVAARDRSWWIWKLPLAVGVAALLAWLTSIVVDKWWKPFPDALPTDVIVWIGVGYLGLALTAARFSTLRWPWRIASLAGAVMLLIVAANQANRHYQEYPTLRAALGPWIGESTDFKDVAGKGNAGALITAPAGRTIADVWTAPAGMPTTGTVSEVTIPPTASHFTARNAWVYLPPAYQATPRPQLPVLVLFSGQPGSPRDWIDALGLQSALDSYAAAHHGLAPVAVIPDATGSEFGNPLCLDSNLGNAETYLTTDVKNWITANLQVAPPSAGWTVGGYSYGGTCALQLAVRAPTLYKTFLDMSGQQEPTLGSRAETVDKAFGGDAAAFTKVNPLDVLATTRFPDTAGVIVAGDSDGEYTPGQHVVFAACQKAGMDVTFVGLPGGHGFQVWRAGLVKELPWIAERNGLAKG